MLETGSSRRRRLSRTTLVLAQVAILCMSLLGPAFASAAEPSADPSATPIPSSEPSTEPSPEPSVEPTSDPTPAPTPDPTPAPTPDTTPAPTPDPTPAPCLHPRPRPFRSSSPSPAASMRATQAATLAAAGALETGSVPVLRMHSILLAPSGRTTVAAAIRADAQRPAVSTPIASARPRPTPDDTSLRRPVVPAEDRLGQRRTASSPVRQRGRRAPRHRRRWIASGPRRQLVAGTSILDGSRRHHRPERPRHRHGRHRRRRDRQRRGHRRRRLRRRQGHARHRPRRRRPGPGQRHHQGVVWAVDHGADVILMGFANPGYSSALQAAIDYAWANGVVIVAATGNDGSSTVTFPAGDRGVIGVSNTDSVRRAGRVVQLRRRPCSSALPASGSSLTTAGGGIRRSPARRRLRGHVAAAAALLRAVDPSASNGIDRAPVGPQRRCGGDRGRDGQWPAEHRVERSVMSAADIRPACGRGACRQRGAVRRARMSVAA